MYDRIAIGDYVQYEPREAHPSYDDIIWGNMDPAVVEILSMDEDYGRLIAIVGSALRSPAKPLTEAA